MILSFHPCFVAGSQVILAFRKLNPSHLMLIRSAEGILLPQSCPSDLYQACKRSPALVFPNYDVRFEYSGKIGQSLLFHEKRFPHPITARWPSVEEFRKGFQDSEDFLHRPPFLLKTDTTHEAAGVYLIKDEAELDRSLERLARFEQTGSSGFISQELIDTKGNVLRAVIFGHRIVTYWKRTENDGEIIVSAGENAKIDKDWRPDLQEKGRVMARIFSKATGVNLAAVDFLFPLSQPDPQPLFLEINYYFGRRGLGGSENYYRLLYETIQEWLTENGLNPESVTLV